VTPMPKAILLLAVAAALTSSASDIFARGGGGGAHPVTTSSKSTTPSGSANVGTKTSTIQSKARVCQGHHCITVPRQGTTPAGGGGGPNRGGVDNPALHPK
jgi:hypothetical protein